MENIGAPPVSSSSRPFYAPLLVSMLGIVCTALGLVIYHFFLVKYCMRQSRSSSSSSQTRNTSSSLSVSNPDPNLETGVDPKILDTIPILAYSTSNSNSNSRREPALFRADQNECTVCLGELGHGEMVRLLPNCRHAFHVQCIGEWFVAHANCPVCRSPITEAAVVNDPLPPPCDGGSNDVEENGVIIIHGDIIASSSSTIKNSPVKSPSLSVSSSSSRGLLRHCGSMVLSLERKSSSSQTRVIPGLRRSLSMDQSFFVMNVEKDNENDLRTNFDGVSSMLLRSFSRLRMGKGSQILPY